MKVFPNLIPFIKDYEQFFNKPYFATPREKALGILTKGYGTTLKVNSPGAYNPITETEACILLSQELTRLEMKVLGSSLSDSKKDAILSLLYNMGENACPNLLAFYRKGDMHSAAQEFMNGISQRDHKGDLIPLEGLLLRRCSEYDMFTKGVYHRIFKEDGITDEQRSILLLMNGHKPLAVALINKMKARVV